MPVLTLLDIAKMNKSDAVAGLIDETTKTHPELRDICQERFGGFAAWIARDLVAAKEMRCPKATFDAESLGAYFLSIVQGSLLLLKAHAERATMERNLLHFRDYLRMLYGP